MKIKVFNISLLYSSLLLSSCATHQSTPTSALQSAKADDLFIVDCLLPGQVRSLGQVATYITARRAIKTSAGDCGIRGGEYVSYDRANYSTALNIWLPKAQSGDPQAQNYVGEIYEKGLGTEPDYDMAQVWYKKAAKQGFSKAQMNLGNLYEEGLGVERNQAIAFEWYGKSSKLSQDNIAYATSLSSSKESPNPLSAELKLLKSSLKNSQTEAKQLKKKLISVQNNLLGDKKNLAQLKKEFARVQQQNTQVSSGNESSKLQKILHKKTQKINKQQASIEQLEKEYKKEILTLSEKLTHSQKRAEQIVTELKKGSSQSENTQIALLQMEVKLAETEKQLLQVNKVSSQRLTELGNVKKTITSQGQSLQQAEDKLKEMQLKVQQQQAEKDRLSTKISALKKGSSQSENTQVALVEMEAKFAEAEKQLLQANQLSDQQLSELNRVKETVGAQGDSLQQAESKLNEMQAEKNRLSAKNADDKALSDSHILAMNSKTDEVEALKKTLLSDRQAYEKKIEALKNQVKNELSTEKPVIEIIDPAFVLTRSGMPTVKLRSVVSQREVVGKINSLAGLLSLSVNDVKREVNEKGLFKTNIPLATDETPVHIVAVDNNGEKTRLNFMISLEGATKQPENSLSTASVTAQKGWKKLNFGNYHALIIANNNYQKVPKLDTPDVDARAVEKVLKNKYGFKTQLLLDGTRYQILSALNKLRASLTKDDNLLIYYAGHGELDKVNMRGHWLPVDADADNTANWISTVAITDILNSMSAQHVMVVSDSCYSGAMTRSSMARLDAGLSGKQRNDWLKAMVKARSRTVLASGGLKPVMDGGGGDHSVFASAFIKALQGNNELLEGQLLYRAVSNNIVAIAADYGIEQVPEYAPIRHAGHEAGEFFFVPSQ